MGFQGDYGIESVQEQNREIFAGEPARLEMGMNDPVAGKPRLDIGLFRNGQRASVAYGHSHHVAAAVQKHREGPLDLTG